MGRLEHKHRVLITVGAGTGISVVDASASVVALPAIASWFGADLPTVQWVMVGNLLAVAALLVPMGRLGDLLGRKTLFVSGFFIFALASLLAVFSSEISTLIVARVLAGIGSSMAQANGIPILLNNFGESDRGRVLGIQMGVVGVGAITGPALGGFIVSLLSWKAIFWVSAAGTLLVSAAAQLLFRRLHIRDRDAARRYDWPGAALSAAFLIAFLSALANGPRIGWTHPGVGWSLSAAAALLLTFLWWARRVTSPMLDLALFTRPLFTLGLLGGLANYMAMSSMRFVIPFHLAAAGGLSPAKIGLALVPGAIITATVGPFAGRISDFWGTRPVANAGLVVAALGLLTLSGLHPGTSTAYVVISIMIMAVGGAIFHAPNSSSIMGTVDQSSFGVAASFVNLARNAGNVMGVALAAAVISATMSSRGYPPNLDGFDGDYAMLSAYSDGARITFLILLSALLAVLGAIGIWGMRRRPG